MPKISIIIPVFNVVEHVEKCVRSVMQQTLQDIEIICVDDASTDGSLKILLTLAAEDARVKVLTLPENLTANQARKNGVLASSGDTVMFLDGDDELLPHACETVSNAVSKHQVDVLHFGAHVINKSGVSKSRIQWNQKNISPCLEFISGNLISSCFDQNKFFFTLWNKAFRGDLSREAFSYIQDGKYPRAQDLYAVFVLLYFARTYQGIADVLINYHFGHGITGRQEYDLPSFERFCQASRVANAIHKFLYDQNALEKYGVTAAKIRKNLLLDGVGQWMNHLHPEHSAAGYDLLAHNWGAEELISALAEKSIAESEKFSVKRIASKVHGASIFSSLSIKSDYLNKAKTIGIFYYRFHSGGVQRVISLLIPLFIQWGYRVVLITEQHEPGSEYPLPEGVARVIIPPSLKGENYRARADAFAAALQRHEVDVLNYHATSGPGCLFDLLLAKQLGCKVIFSRHETAFSTMLNSGLVPVWQPAVYALVEKMTVLTRMDEQYYRLMGVAAVFVPNPLPHLELHQPAAHLAPPVILWVGRMDFVYKQCQEPIEIMHEVVRAVPDAKMLMVGGGWTPNAEQSLRDRIKKLGLEKNVELIGYTSNIEEYYRQAACLLITSASESYGMIIEESRAFGLPLVMYELPYLELLQSGKGYIAVEQMDRQAAARALVRVLQNPQLRETLGMQAQTELATANNALLEQRWKENLSFNASSSEIIKEELDTGLLRILMENILYLYSRGVARKSQEVQELRKKINGLTAVNSVPERSIASTSMPISGTKTGIRKTLPNLLDLEHRRAVVGSIGALDFLIELENRMIKNAGKNRV